MNYLKELLDTYAVRGSVAEIGYFRGEGSTPVLLEHVSTHGGHLYSMDLFSDQDVLDKCKRQFAGRPAEPVPGYSVEVGRCWNREKLDFLFIDGDHGFPRVSKDGRQSGAALDILVWHPLLNVGGILAFHDYTGTESEYGVTSLMAVEHAVDAFCVAPNYEFVGRSGHIVAFRKVSDGILYPYFRQKSAPESCRAAWKKLSETGLSRDILIWGTGDSAKHVLDAVLSLNKDADIRFTQSGVEHAGTGLNGYPLLPTEAAFDFRGDILIGSIHEDAIGGTLEQRGLGHVSRYYGYYEFISWYFIGRMQGLCL